MNSEKCFQLNLHEITDGGMYRDFMENCASIFRSAFISHEVSKKKKDKKIYVQRGVAERIASDELNFARRPLCLLAII